MPRGSDVFVKIYTDAIAKAADEGSALARDLSRQADEVMDMADVSSAISEIAGNINEEGKRPAIPS
ncbi:hypothetical protein GCM10027343_16170 [Noviherbaspirillum agri]